MNLHPDTLRTLALLDTVEAIRPSFGPIEHRGTRHDSTRVVPGAGGEPTHHLRYTTFDGAPGVLLTLTTMHGDVTRAAQLQPGMLRYTLTLPAGLAGVTASNPAPRNWVDLSPTPNLPGSRHQWEVALFPDDSQHVAGIVAGLRYRPWLTVVDAWADDLPRAVPPPSFAYHTVDDEGPITTVDQGGATSGNLVRMDYGAEWGALPPHLAWSEADHWRRIVMSRPQRGFLHHADGRPLAVSDAPPGFDLTLGPTELIFPKKDGNVYGFNEDAVAARAGEFLSTIDLAHYVRAFAWDAYLAQRFLDPVALDNLRWWAAAARLDTPSLGSITPGTLGRQHAWNLVVQVLDWRANGTPEARTWIDKALDVLRREMRENGGLCAWMHNKEATAYAPDYLASIGQPRVVQPVTRPEQEMLLAYAWHCADPDGDHELRAKHLRFIFQDCRQPGRRGPWERCALDGSRLSTGDTTHYSGTALAIALHLGIPQAPAWIRDHCGGADTRAKQIAWLRGRKPSDWRNNFHLIGMLEA